MKKLILALAVSFAATTLVPTLAQARDVTFTTTLKNYNGDGAYLALYLVKANGQYQQTIWIAGEKSKYYKHLSGWARGSGQRTSEYEGLSGASVSRGRTLNITLDIADELIDAGYQVRIDTSVEDMRDNPAEISAPLITSNVGKPFLGRGYIKSFQFSF